MQIAQLKQLLEPLDDEAEIYCISRVTAFTFETLYTQPQVLDFLTNIAAPSGLTPTDKRKYMISMGDFLKSLESTAFERDYFLVSNAGGTS